MESSRIGPVETRLVEPAETRAGEPVEARVAEQVETRVVEPAGTTVAAAEKAVAVVTPFRRRWTWRSVSRLTLVALAMIAVATILLMSLGALTPFIIGLVLAYLMLPLVSRLERRMPRWAAILVTYVLTFGALGFGLTYVISPAVGQINELRENIPDWYRAGSDAAERLIFRFRREAPEEVQQRVREQIAQIQETAQENASNWSQQVAGFLFNSVRRIFQTITFLLGFLIIPFFLYYVLLDSRRMPEAINRMLHPRIRDDFWNILRIVDTIFGKYIRGQLILGLIVGVISFAGLTALNLAGFKVSYTILLALVAAIGELIPVVGPIISAIPAILVGWTDGGQTALAVTILYVLIQQVENQYLVPRIVGNALRLHAAILMALLVVASAIGGLLLVILVAPLAAIARDVFLYVHQRLEEPPVPPTAAIARVLDEDSTAGR